VKIGRIWLWPTRHGPITVLRRKLSRDIKARFEGGPLRRPYEPPRGTTHRVCQWIAGQPDGQRTQFCGAPVAPGCSWCATHRAAVFQPPPEEKPDP
jgi:hypothetical protein